MADYDENNATCVGGRSMTTLMKNAVKIQKEKDEKAAEEKAEKKADSED